MECVVGALSRSLPFYGLQDGRKSGQGIVDLIERAAGLQRFSGDGQNHFAPMAEILGHDLEQRPGIHRLLPGLTDRHRKARGRHSPHEHGGSPCMEADLCGDDGFVLGQTGSFDSDGQMPTAILIPTSVAPPHGARVYSAELV